MNSDIKIELTVGELALLMDVLEDWIAVNQNNSVTSAMMKLARRVLEKLEQEWRKEQKG